MKQPNVSPHAELDPASRRRRLRRVKRTIDLVPSARIPELEDFVWRLLPEPLTEDLTPLEDLRAAVRGWTAPRSLEEIDRLADRELNRLLLLAWIMQQPPEDSTRDWDAIHSRVQEVIGDRRGIAPDARSVPAEDMAEQLLELWNAVTEETIPGQENKPCPAAAPTKAENE